MNRLTLCICGLIAAMSGCGEEASRERDAGETTVPPAPPTITAAHSGRSFTLAAGSETRLRLPGEYDWSEPTVRGEAVRLDRVDYFQDPGFSEWTVVAVQPGTATIAARGRPAATDRQGSRGTPLRFHVELTVAP